jgi:hypothetical protein
MSHGHCVKPQLHEFGHTPTFFSCFFLIKSVGNGAIDHHMFAGRDQDKFNYHLGLVGMWGTHICGTRPEEKSVAICGPY